MEVEEEVEGHLVWVEAMLLVQYHVSVELEIEEHLAYVEAPLPQYRMIVEGLLEIEVKVEVVEQFA